MSKKLTVMPVTPSATYFLSILSISLYLLLDTVVFPFGKISHTLMIDYIK
ncbi:hypothetical protein QQ7_2751 [Clostridioides difficile Y307]|nr:hypothetical protein [Clostridioides difficile]EQI56993.1 hypothetical protein QQ7_2751 [Clostridioides difficile Y307]